MCVREIYTICPTSSEPILYSNYIKRVTTSWTHRRKIVCVREIYREIVCVKERKRDIEKGRI